MNQNTMSTREILDTIKLAHDTAEGIFSIRDKKRKEREIEAAKLKMRCIDQEDLELIEENYEAREMFTQQGIKNLYLAVCNQAVHDYKQASKYVAKGQGTPKSIADAERIRDDADRFFGDEFFMNVTGMRNKDTTKELIHKQMRREAQKALVK